MLTLHSYWRSTAAYRVRVALNVKGLDYQTESVHLVKDGGQQHTESYRRLNPQGLVPTLITESGEALSQSLAIIEYLDERYPEPALLPKEPLQRARVRSVSQAIACDMHPLNNLRVLQYLSGKLAVTDEQKTEWYHHWLLQGFAAVEAEVAKSDGPFCFGDQLTLADLVLVPQLYNARRFKFPLTAFPRIEAIEKHCLELDVFQRAIPENQPDAVQAAN